MTPEERLLRLIESGERAKKLAFWDVRAWAPLLLPDKKTVRRVVASWSSRRWAPRELNLKLLNRGLIVLLVLVAAAIALNTQRVRPSPMDLSRPVRSAMPSAMPSAKEEQPLAALRPLEDYLREVEQRDLFNPVAPPQPEPPKEEAKVQAEPVKPPPVPTKPPEPTALEILQEKAKTLKLVGIAWGPVPVAMIEDTVKRETSFLKGGDSINQIRIKAILRDRVVLSYENADYDLF